MLIDCISDLHGYYPKLLGGDLLIIAGDLTAQDTEKEHADFIKWLADIQHSPERYKKIIYIAGNHDGFLDPNSEYNQTEKRKGMPFKNIHTPPLWNIDYLCDSGTEFEGVKIWGSPWIPTFFDWYFMKERGPPIKKMWDKIPSDTAILITHSPPFDVLDELKGDNKIGCCDLREAVGRVQPLLHVFGHVHEGYGTTVMKFKEKEVMCVNASIMNENYEPVNGPIRIEL